MATIFRKAAQFLARAAIAVSALLAGTPALASNNAPIVMVHGFLGFGPEELQGTGFLYWGGFNDIAGDLRTANGTHSVYVASVGPISSNWDRAVELYYQIKGGCADYGALHTAQYAQYGAIQKPAGKCWPGFYPAWDANHPIHLISHSQGGQTVRTLIQLLEHGSPNGNEGDSALFAGGHTGWVTSATTISTPHNGTSLAPVIVNYVPNVSSLLGDIISFLGLGGSSNPVYDFKLQQFGVAQGPAESWSDFINRLSGAPFFSLSNHDSAQWDLSPDGAAQLNSWVTTAPDVYYYSIATSATEAGAICCNGTDYLFAPIQLPWYQYPREDMIEFLKPTAGQWVVPSILVNGMGSYTISGGGHVTVDSTWFTNDGVVNTNSMQGPSGQPQIVYNGASTIGAWNYLGLFNTWDHFSVIGWQQSGSTIYPVYEDLASILYSL